MPYSKARGRVLIVDDDADLRETMVALLQDQFDTFEAKDGIDALAFLDTHSVDVVLLDENMPKMGGHECFALMRQRSLNIPVIFSTGQPCDSDKKRELNMGAFDYLEKPFEAENLILLVGEAHSAMIRIRQILERKAV